MGADFFVTRYFIVPRPVIKPVYIDKTVSLSQLQTITEPEGHLRTVYRTHSDWDTYVATSGLASERVL